MTGHATAWWRTNRRAGTRLGLLRRLCTRLLRRLCLSILWIRIWSTILRLSAGLLSRISSGLLSCVSGSAFLQGMAGLVGTNLPKPIRNSAPCPGATPRQPVTMCKLSWRGFNVAAFQLKWPMAATVVACFKIPSRTFLHRSSPHHRSSTCSTCIASSALPTAPPSRRPCTHQNP
jgi:hypothetical protein